VSGSKAIKGEEGLEGAKASWDSFLRVRRGIKWGKKTTSGEVKTFAQTAPATSTKRREKKKNEEGKKGCSGEWGSSGLCYGLLTVGDSASCRTERDHSISNCKVQLASMAVVNIGGWDEGGIKSAEKTSRRKRTF